MEINLLDTFGHKHLAMRGEKEIHMKDNSVDKKINTVLVTASETAKVALTRIFNAFCAFTAKILARVGLKEYAPQVTVFLLAVVALQVVQATPIGVAATRFIGAVVAKAVSFGIAAILAALGVRFVKSCLVEATREKEPKNGSDTT